MPEPLSSIKTIDLSIQVLVKILRTLYVGLEIQNYDNHVKCDRKRKLMTAQEKDPAKNNIL